MELAKVVRLNDLQQKQKKRDAKKAAALKPVTG